MKLNTKYIDSCSTPSSTMKRKICYKDTLFERAKLTPIRGKLSLETLHKLRNEIKANTK